MEGLLDIVRFAADKGFKTNIATNAYLIDEDMAKRIADSGLSTINISLDSIKESTHDYLRGVKGVYESVMKAIEYLDKHCPKLQKGICSVIYEINIDDIIELTEAVEKDNRLDWIYFMAAMQPNNTKPDSEWYKREFSYLWPKDINKVHFVINRLIELKNRGYKIVNHTAQLKAFKSYFVNPQKFVKTAQCNLSRALHISSVGDVFICFQWDKLGNIKSDRLKDLWNSDKAEVVRRNISRCRRNCHFLVNCFFEGDFPFSF
jgi:MoaA/NifB/PqqE/SkfB family radical SAM enzyme